MKSIHVDSILDIRACSTNNTLLVEINRNVRKNQPIWIPGRLDCQGHYLYDWRLYNKKVALSDQLAEELHKTIKRRFPTRRVIVGGVDDTWSADLVDMQSFSKHNGGVKYLLNVIDVFSKYAWSVPLIDKTGKLMIRSFDTIVGKKETK